MATKKRTDADADTFSAEEKAAMKERASELKRARSTKDPEADVLAKIAEMEGDDKAIAESLHALVKKVAPDMGCKTWYGFPAYMVGKEIVFFFQPAKKFGTRYGTLGFNDSAKLDDGDIWPSAFAIPAWTAQVETKVADLIKRAVGA
ncbi:hypothetical protein [Tessaracoccus sp. ZS01]|uniref:hypothetical protein n=1 Tax=Tessaracoccus sp. ZS01 TaxID=1906324 RepID=UPI00096F0C23|nr:hypothetical protein [Tessaracoccus sp. ZS01]MCG6566089.1 hypothetical protein [Tessaracoccus sp. ZS01]OMG58593.1 hypothetical protein BJN44_00365 [Tessaracoccus sp. ZS01]